MLGKILMVMKKLIHPKEFFPVLSFKSISIFLPFKSIFSLERSSFCPFFVSSSARLHFETVDVQCVHLGCCSVCGALCASWFLCSVCTLVVVQCAV